MFWPWLFVVTGYCYGIMHSIDGVLLVLISGKGPKVHIHDYVCEVHDTSYTYTTCIDTLYPRIQHGQIVMTSYYFKLIRKRTPTWWYVPKDSQLSMTRLYD